MRFSSKKLVWGTIFSSYLALAYISEKITFVGLLLAILFFLQVHYLSQSQSVAEKYFWCTGIFIWAVFAKLHVLPGFNNWHIIANKKISFDAIPYNLYVNFDTPIIGIVVTTNVLKRL